MLQSEINLNKEKKHIDRLCDKELDEFITKEKNKALTPIGEFKIGYALLKKNFIDEAFIYFNKLKDYNNILYFKKTFKNSDGSYTTYDFGDINQPTGDPNDPDDPGCCLIGCICGGCIITICCQELGCFEWSDCPACFSTCPCCCCSWFCGA